jgi:hypothetical protein
MVYAARVARSSGTGLYETQMQLEKQQGLADADDSKFKLQVEM